MFNNLMLNVVLLTCVFVDKSQNSEQNLLNDHDGLLQSSLIQINNNVQKYTVATGKVMKID
jgi:hypothetical protein